MMNDNVELEIYEGCIEEKIFTTDLNRYLRNTKSYFKDNGIVSIIVWFIMIILFGAFFVRAILDLGIIIESLIVLIPLLCILLIFVVFFIEGILYIVRYNRILDDLKNKRFTIIYEKPKKIKIIRNKQSKYGRKNILEFIKLYFNDVTLLVPYSKKSRIKYFKNIKVACKECEDIKTRLYYLSSSKIVVRGGDKYLGKVNKYLM